MLPRYGALAKRAPRAAGVSSAGDAVLGIRESLAGAPRREDRAGARLAAADREIGGPGRAGTDSSKRALRDRYTHAEKPGLRAWSGPADVVGYVAPARTRRRASRAQLWTPRTREGAMRESIETDIASFGLVLLSSHFETRPADLQLPNGLELCNDREVQRSGRQSCYTPRH